MTNAPSIQKSLSRILFYDDEEECNIAKSNDPKENNYLSDSMSELGQIAILSSSKASLKYQARKRNTSVASKALAESLGLIGEKANVEEATEEDKPTESGCLSSLVKIKGSLYGIISACLFVSSNVVMKRSIYMSPTDHSAIRYTVTFIIMLMICKYNKLKILGPRKHFKLLLARGMLGSFSLVAFYFSIMCLAPSDSVTLIHSSLIITAIISRIFLGEKLTLAHFVAIILTANGILFISKPSFLFNKESTLNSSNFTTTHLVESQSQSESFKPILGGFFFLESL